MFYILGIAYHSRILMNALPGVVLTPMPLDVLFNFVIELSESQQ